jgi:hypothetical protein
MHSAVIQKQQKTKAVSKKKKLESFEMRGSNSWRNRLLNLLGGWDRKVTGRPPPPELWQTNPIRADERI